MIKTLKQRLAEGQSVNVMSIGPLASPKLIEIVSLYDKLHGVWIDQEHIAISHERLELLALACRAVGLDAFARVAPTDYATVMRPMETGANGVMAAQIRSVEQVHQVVQWAKYPPMGVRGLFLGNYESGYATSDPSQHVKAANRDRWLVIQIETAEAVEAADQIAAVDGVDCLFVGPGDLACTLGVPGQAMHPKCLAALEKIAAAAEAAGKPWGALSKTADHVARCRDLGCRLFSIFGDVDLVHRGFQATMDAFDVD